MAFRWWDRWGALSGVLSVILFLVFLIVFAGGPDDNDAKIVAYYAKDSNQTKQIVGFLFFFACLLLLLLFLAYLRGVLIRAEGEPGRLTALAYGGGVTTTVLLMVANALFVGTAITADDAGSKFKLDPNSYRLLNDTGYAVFISGVMSAIVLVAATSVLALRTGVFPRWFGWVGIAAAVTFVVAFAFIPVFVFFGWILVASGLLVWWLPRARSTAAPVPAAS